MKILLLILFLSLLGALIGVDGMVFCISVLLLLPALYFTFGIFFTSPFLAYISFIFAISLLLLLYRVVFLRQRNFLCPNEILSHLTNSLVFTVIYSFFYLLCTKWPDFYSLGERMRDLALVGAGIRDPIFIQEPWMSGAGLNYYAYWYRFVHILSTLLNLKNWEVYHIIVAFAASFLAITFFIFSRQVLNFSLKRSLYFSSLLMLMSNPAGAVYFFKSDVTWWYPSRVVNGTIHEFPAWSFLLGDAHPHFLNSGSLLWFLLLSFLAFNAGANSLLVALSALILPVLFFQNANMWEVPIWLAAYGSFLFVFLLRAWFEKNVLASIRAVFRQINFKFLAFCLLLCFIAVCFFQMKANFIPDDLGVGYVKGEVHGSAPVEFLLHWGFFILPILLVQVLAVKEGRFFLLLLIIGSLFFKIILPFLLILFLINFLRLRAVLKNAASLQQLFCEAIVFLALGLLIVPELVFLDDPYGGDIERMNTFFKISYTNWALMFFATVYLLKDFRLDKLSVPCFVVLTSFFLAAIQLRGVDVEWSLRGLNFIERGYPGSKATVEFLSVQAPGTVLEAQGPPYSETSMIATLTGFPAYLGWINHLDLLMPTQRDEIQRRNSIVQQIYQSTDCQERLVLLVNEKITYLVLGNLEKKSYPNLQDLDFSCLTQVFEDKDYKLFAISQ